MVQRLPQGAVSRAWGWLARREQPRVGVSLLKRVFVQATGIDMSEAGADLGDYATLEDLFVRKLKPGARRIDPEPEAVASPVDGTVGASGVVEAGTLLQVKGRAYSLGALLDDDAAAARYEGGPYATLYLAPRDYHRIHAPLSGQVTEAQVIPGALMPVFPEALYKVDGLFARNERIITYMDTPNAGRLAVVKVGATLVGRITLAYDPEVWSNQPNGQSRHLTYDPPQLIQKGGEIGAFELGSTVVLVAEPGRLLFEDLSEGVKVRMGQRIGTVAAAKTRRKATPGKPPRRRKDGPASKRSTPEK
ncbi:MAG TPA: archaetidylserine decarboxylase [Myxococcota bacterium]|nr:archaetidylserine decarboxylase [Myxococcota bacterium]